VADLLDDMLNLEILENICYGTGVEVNISALSSTFKRHRNTIKEQVKALFEHHILDRPIYPFIWLYQEYPMLVVVRADLPRTEQVDKFLKEDAHIFGAFYVRDEEYNTLLIEFFRDLHSYVEWRKNIVAENRIPPRENRYPSQSLFFSNQNIVKYQPQSPIFKMEEQYKKGEELELNGYRLNNLCFQILKKLVLGEGIRTNENLLAQKLNVHRKTIERRIVDLVNAGIVTKPACRFPKFFVPPDHILVYYLVEIKKSMDRIIKAIKSDPSIPLALETNIGRYNLLLFGAFINVEDHFKWEEQYENRFPECIGAMKKIYLSPQMTASIDQQKVSLNIIRQRKESLAGKGLLEAVRPQGD
jgi:DNA-binding Lrp family transcriptional regulator